MNLLQDLALLPKYWPVVLGLGAVALGEFANCVLRLVQIRMKTCQLDHVPWYANAMVGVATVALILAFVAVVGAFWPLVRR